MHLTIKEADNRGGGAIVVMDNAQYKKMCMDILDNSQWYLSISFKELDSFTCKFYRLVDEARDNGVIDITTWTYIRTPHPRILTFIVYQNFRNLVHC